MLTSAPFLAGAFDETLARYRLAAVGRYVATYMTRAMEGLRLLGLVGVWAGAWYHRPTLMAGGLTLILTAWARGWLAPRQPSG